MMQAEGTRTTVDDKRELERSIKELKDKINDNMYSIGGASIETIKEWNKELRRLRRLR